MTTESDGVPRILLRYSLTDEEVRAYFRASAARQQHAVFWPKLSWMAYLGAFPVGLFGASLAIAFGIDPHAFGGLVAALVGLGYICGYYITLMVAKIPEAARGRTGSSRAPRGEGCRGYAKWVQPSGQLLSDHLFLEPGPGAHKL